MEDHKEDFADLLSRYRMHAGLKQQELANKIGVHRKTIVNWENRTSWPKSRGQVLRLADEFSLSKDERKAFLHAAGFPLNGGQQKCGRSLISEICFSQAVTMCSAPFENCSSPEARRL